MKSASERFPVVRIVGFAKRRRHPYRAEKFMIGSYVGLMELQERIADRSIGREEIRVLLLMMTACDYGNRVRVGQKELAADLKMALSNVSRAITALVNSGFLERDSTRGGYTISPRLCWKGDDDSLREALAARNMLDSEGFMRGAA